MRYNSDRIRILINELKRYIDAYDRGTPTMSDKEYDDLYFELKELEEKTGIIYPDSPTQTINYEFKNELKKVQHNHPMLSLDKTKDWNEFLEYFVSKDVIGMLKLDGLTCSLKYINGELISAETRGNGEIGEDILHNARVIKSIPQKILYKDELVIDGEIICTDEDFKPFADLYKNSRNFASGSIRLLDSKECESRNLTFVAWNIVKGFDTNSFLDKLHKIKEFGFTITPYTTSFDWDAKEFLIDKAKELGYPIDGLVGRFDDISYGESLGSTGHHSKAAYAFKFYDEEVETRLREIEWSMGRTGILTPVAIFEPVEIDGTTVSRASLHNLGIMDEILGTPVYNQRIWVSKRNMIIPQVERAEKHPEATTSLDNMAKCPYCGKRLKILEHNGVSDLYCPNPDCDAKLINQLDHFCGKKGFDIKGLSINTLNKLIDWGWINNSLDIFNLKEHRKEWIKKDGFGVASVDNILNAIEASKDIDFTHFLPALGIPLVGESIAKLIAPYVNSWDEFLNRTSFDDIDGIGYEIDTNIKSFDYTIANNLVNNVINLTFPKKENSNKLTGLTFCITGSLNQFKNRKELEDAITAAGGKCTGSVSKKTSYLINNDTESTSGKNKKAKELNIPIISEKYLLENILTL